MQFACIFTFSNAYVFNLFEQAIKYFFFKAILAPDIFNLS